MTNGTIKDALGSEPPSFDAEIELLDDELDEVAGGCGNFTCRVYKVV